MRLLDLFCGEGLAAWGYWRSGRFSEIVGVDIHDMRNRYAFDFIQRDAMTLDYEFLMSFDFIHASPPCQFYSKVTPKAARKNHPRLIADTHRMLYAAGVPYVIENVEGSGHELKPNFVLSGHDVGLPILRKRYFHISTRETSNMSNAEKINQFPGANLSIDQRVNVHGSRYVSRDKLIKAFGLDTIPLTRRRLLTIAGIHEGIPPAFTKLIAEMVIQDKARIA